MIGYWQYSTGSDDIMMKAGENVCTCKILILILILLREAGTRDTTNTYINHLCLTYTFTFIQLLQLQRIPIPPNTDWIPHIISHTALDGCMDGAVALDNTANSSGSGSRICI